MPVARTGPYREDSLLVLIRQVASVTGDERKRTRSACGGRGKYPWLLDDLPIFKLYSPGRAPPAGWVITEGALGGGKRQDFELEKKNS